MKPPRGYLPVLITLIMVAVLAAAGTRLAAQEAQAEPEESPATSPPAAEAQPLLVPLSTAAACDRPVKIAGAVDHGSLQTTTVDGKPGYTFALSDHDGNRLQVEGSGTPPIGLEQSDVVVVAGQGRGEVFHADSVLIPGIAAWPDPNRGLWNVMVITMIVWLGLFAYLFWLDYKRRLLEDR